MIYPYPLIKQEHSREPPTNPEIYYFIEWWPQKQDIPTAGDEEELGGQEQRDWTRTRTRSFPEAGVSDDGSQSQILGRSDK